jgi:hypothetical protein
MDVSGKRTFRFRCVSLVRTCSYKPALYEGKNTTVLAVFPELGLLYVLCISGGSLSGCSVQRNGTQFGIVGSPRPGRRIRIHRDSLVGTATRYGLDGMEFESRWRRDFPHLSKPAPIGRVPGLF